MAYLEFDDGEGLLLDESCGLIRQLALLQAEMQVLLNRVSGYNPSNDIIKQWNHYCEVRDRFADLAGATEDGWTIDSMKKCITLLKRELKKRH